MRSRTLTPQISLILKVQLGKRRRSNDKAATSEENRIKYLTQKWQDKPLLQKQRNQKTDSHT